MQVITMTRQMLGGYLFAAVGVGMAIAEIAIRFLGWDGPPYVGQAAFVVVVGGAVLVSASRRSARNQTS